MLNSIKEDFPDIDYEILMLKDMDLKDCYGCYACINRGPEHCPLKDDRDVILKKMEEAEVLANKVAIIDKGKFSAIGSPEELISKYGGLKVLTIRNGDKKLADALQKKFGQTSLSSDGDVNVKVDNVDEMWRVMATLTEMKVKRDIKIQTPTMDDVFLKITGGRITEEGELQ